MFLEVKKILGEKKFKKKKKKKKFWKWKLLKITWAAQKSHFQGGGAATDRQLDRQHHRVTCRVAIDRLAARRD